MEKFEILQQSLWLDMEQLKDSNLPLEDRKKGLLDLLKRFSGSDSGIKQRIALEWLATGGLNLPEDMRKESRALMMAMFGDADTPKAVKQAIWDHVLRQTEEHLSKKGASTEQRPIDFLALIELHKGATPEEKQTLDALMLRTVNETHLPQENRAEAREFLHSRTARSNDPMEKFEILQQSLWLDMEQLKDSNLPLEDRKNELLDLGKRFSGSDSGIKQRIALEWLAAGGLNLPDDTRTESRALAQIISKDTDTPEEVQQAIARHYRAPRKRSEAEKVPKTSQGIESGDQRKVTQN
jgi:hypothetical protein